MTAQNVVDIALAYGVSPLRGLVAIGLLQEADVSGGTVESALREATDEQLVDEIMRRLQSASSDEEDTAFDRPVASLRSVSGSAEDDWEVSEPPAADLPRAAMKGRKKIDE
ncbi:hypothetical protein MN032_10790 [Agromyces atrinae]|uniref:hypothetical protein n=1 Tax=Agromyces atrinae TaxID=592376 RepID=UPI001F5612A5|nr:hypothetical protein [Agromyces atrinae]MCI2958183.1 hypothetical protein [Agromyces atrinae]